MQFIFVYTWCVYGVHKHIRSLLFSNMEQIYLFQVCERDEKNSCTYLCAHTCVCATKEHFALIHFDSNSTLLVRVAHMQCNSMDKMWADIMDHLYSYSISSGVGYTRKQQQQHPKIKATYNNVTNNQRRKKNNSKFICVILLRLQHGVALIIIHNSVEVRVYWNRSFRCNHRRLHIRFKIQTVILLHSYALDVVGTKK